MPIFTREVITYSKNAPKHLSSSPVLKPAANVANENGAEKRLGIELHNLVPKSKGKQSKDR